MRLRIFLFTIVVSVLFEALTVYAEPPVFQDSEDEIVEALTKKNETTRTREVTRNAGDAARTRTIVVKALEKKQEVKETITVYPDNPGPKANLKIEFDYDSYRIRPNAYTLLKELGKALTSESLQSQTFYINGHTDSDGPQSYNLDLSLKRAQTVKDFLTGSFNISPDRLNVRGYGEAMPLVENTTQAKKQINRRVEIKPAR